MKINFIEIPGRKPRKAPERDLHIACVQYVDLQYGERLFYFHSPNGGTRNKAEAAMFQKMGVLKGLPDLVFLNPLKSEIDTAKGYFESKTGLVIELKAKGKKTDKDGDQEMVMARMERLNYQTYVIDSLDEFIRVIDLHYGYLKLKKA